MPINITINSTEDAILNDKYHAAKLLIKNIVANCSDDSGNLNFGEKSNSDVKLLLQGIFRRLSIKYHPDVTKTGDQSFAFLSSAHDTLQENIDLIEFIKKFHLSQQATSPRTHYKTTVPAEHGDDEFLIIEFDNPCSLNDGERLVSARINLTKLDISYSDFEKYYDKTDPLTYSNAINNINHLFSAIFAKKPIPGSDFEPPILMRLNKVLSEFNLSILASTRSKMFQRNYFEFILFTTEKRQFYCKPVLGPNAIEIVDVSPLVGGRPSI